MHARTHTVCHTEHRQPTSMSSLQWRMHVIPKKAWHCIHFWCDLIGVETHDWCGDTRKCLAATIFILSEVTLSWHPYIIRSSLGHHQKSCQDRSADWCDNELSSDWLLWLILVAMAHLMFTMPRISLVGWMHHLSLLHLHPTHCTSPHHQTSHLCYGTHIHLIIQTSHLCYGTHHPD